MGVLETRQRLFCIENLLAICCVLLALSQISVQQQQENQLAANKQEVASLSLVASTRNSPNDLLARFKRQSSFSSRASRERTRSRDEDDNLSNFENADSDNYNTEESNEEPNSSRIRREWVVRPVGTQVSATAMASVIPVRGNPSSSQHVATSVVSSTTGNDDAEDSPKALKESPETRGLSDKMKKEGWVRHIPIRREEETSKFDSLQKRLDQVDPAKDPDVGFEQQEQVKTPESEDTRAVPKPPAAHRPYFSSARLPSKPRPKSWQRQSEDDSAGVLQREEQQQQDEPAVVERPKPKLRKVYADKATRRPVLVKKQGYSRDTDESGDDCDDGNNGSGEYNDFMRMVAAIPMRQFRQMMNKAFDSMEASAGLAGDESGSVAEEREDQDGDYSSSSRGRGSTIAASASVFNSGGGNRGGRGYSREESLVSNNGRTRGIISETRNGRTQTRRIGERDDSN